MYAIGLDTRFTTKADTLRSDEPVPEWTRGGNPGNWEPVEWAELLDGRLGNGSVAEITLVFDTEVSVQVALPAPRAHWLSDRSALLGTPTPNLRARATVGVCRGRIDNGAKRPRM